MDAEQVFDEAVEMTDPAERAAYLDRACQGDERLRSEVEVLLEANKRVGDFLESPAAGVTLDSSPRIGGPGTAIGRYELLELIGEGGMGLVYLAEQKEPVRRRVALKIIKPGMDSRQVIARFEAERQALALLDHPNVAHVFDAGTTEAGRPYFVMEYVKGMSITRYCDEHRLDVEQRLRLFREVCEGVHHAHQKGIIHRDIKPSNILVSMHGDRAVPKIIDFGIAKAAASTLTEKTMFTLQGQLLGTPEYMSPEQVDLATQDIDTRSDIYSLGVVLYEILAGVLPFESESLQEIGLAELQRTLREQEPASPSIRLANLGEKAKAIADSRMTQVVPLARRLHRELEWIPLKAMRKDRCRRYKSASDMADDIQSYLNGNPLSAGPETAMYRVQKFVRRHAGSVATAAIIAVAIILGLVISTTMYFKAEKARVRAEKAEETTQQALQRESIARTQAEDAEKVAQEQRKLAEEQRTLAEERVEEYRRSLYFNRIALAEVAYHSRDILRVQELLESCPEDLRGWEWYRLSHISDQSFMTLRGHDVGALPVMSGVRAAEFSPDGKHVISCGDDATIKLWDVSTGIESKTLRAHTEGSGWGGVYWAALSPDGKRIVSSGRWDDKKINIWDVATGGELMAVDSQERLVGPISFSPDGKRIVSGTADKMIRVWDCENGAELMTLSGHEGNVSAVAFSPDGQLIVSSSEDKTIKIWDAATGTEVKTIGGHEGSVRWVAWSPDGKQLVSGGDDKTIRVWDANSGSELVTLVGHSKAVVSVAFSSDGKRVVSGSEDNTIKVWDAATGIELATLIGHSKTVNSVAFGADGKSIVSSSDDHTIKMWAVGTREDVVTIDGRSFNFGSMVFSPDGKRIVSGCGNRVLVWDAATGVELMTLSGHQENVFAIVFSPDGERIVSGSKDRTVKIWDAVNGTELMTLNGHEDAVSDAAFSSDGKLIVSGSQDNTIRLWDAVTGDEIDTLRGHKDGVEWVSFSPDGKYIVSGSKDGTIRLWDAINGDEVRSLRGHKDGVRPISLSPDGKHIVLGSHDNTIKLWDLATGAELITLPGRVGQVISASFSPDGKRIVLGSRDGTIKICDSATGTDLMTLRSDQYRVRSVAFSPDGRTIATGDVLGSIRLWKSFTPARRDEPQRNAEAARKMVDQLYEEHGLYQEVIDRLKAEETLDESVREMAMQIASARLGKDPKKLAQEGADQISQYVNEGRYDEAKATLVKILEGTGSEVQKHALKLDSIDKLASSYKDQGRYEEAELLYAKVLEMRLRVLGDRDPATWRSMQLHGLVSLYIDQGHYEKAEQVYVKAVELNPDTDYTRCSLALLQLYAGNVEGYRKTCARMLDHFVRIGRERHDNSFGATSACWACVLAPDAVEDFASAIKLAEAGLIKPYRNDQDHLNLGAILYRAGQFEEAIDKLKELVTTWEKSGLLPNTMSPASAWFFLAMAHHQLGQHEEAEKWLAKANERVELELAGDPRFWARPLVLELLQAEARLLLGASEQ